MEEQHTINTTINFLPQMSPLVISHYLIKKNCIKEC